MLGDLQKRILVSGKKEEADIVIRNGIIINVFTGERMEGDIAICGEHIAGIGSYEGKSIVDAGGRYVVPGFIDGHVHIESSMVTPSEFSRLVLPCGVTTVIADPHEIANVSGSEGIKYMLEDSKSVSLEVYLMLPSCVPATPFENTGSRLEADDLAPFYDHPRVLGLGEVMDFGSLASAEEGMLKKLRSAQAADGCIDGHGAGLDFEELNICMTAGIRTDHECASVEEAKYRLSLGMYLMIRQGSVAKDLHALLPAVTPENARRCIFVTDDKHLDDLKDEGSIDYNVRESIKCGIPPITAVQMATLNAAECFGLKHVGAVAPGYQADILLLDDLEEVAIYQVYKKGKLVAEGGRFLEERIPEAEPLPGLLRSVRFSNITEKQLSIPLKSNSANVIGIIPNSLATQKLIEEVQLQEGCFAASAARDQMKLAVIERHRATGNIGLGIVKGFKLKKGAIASTIAHDSHNLIVVGENDSDMLTAIHHIEEIQGGIAIASEGRILASVGLPVAGLMSLHRHEDLYEELEALKNAAKEIGCTMNFNPFITLAFLALPVIPKLRLTDLGLFDFELFQHIEVGKE